MLLLFFYVFLRFFTLPNDTVEAKEYELLPIDIVDIETLQNQEQAIPEPKPDVSKVDEVEKHKTVQEEEPEPEADDELVKMFESSLASQPAEREIAPVLVSTQQNDESMQITALQSSLNALSAIESSETPNTLDLPSFPNLQKNPTSAIEVSLSESNAVEVHESRSNNLPKKRKSLVKQNPVAEKVDVPLKKADDLGNDFENLKPIYKALVEWMKKNPRELSNVVRTFMGYKAGDLTSKVDITLSGTPCEIFLIVNEEQYEVRVCIVQNNEATLLIDKGFRQQSNYFRIGSVVRAAERRIASFGTSQESASAEKTTQFYRIFLSWWEQVNKDDQDE